MTQINQKEYLKKYLSKDSTEEKKKKKSKKKKKPVVGASVKIIDDDVDINFVVSEEGTISLLDGNEDAPQIVGVIDERPLHLRQSDFKTDSWKPVEVVVIKDEPEDEEERGPGFTINNVKVKKEPSEVSSGRRNSDNSPPRRRNSDNSPPRRSNANQKRRSPDNSPPRKRRKDSDASPPRRRGSDESPPRRRNNGDNSPPRRKNLHNSPPRRKNTDSSPPRRRNADNSPPRRRNADNSPPRRRSIDSSPPRRRNADSSPSRKKSKDSSPPRRSDREESSSRKRSPSRKNSRWEKQASESPPRKGAVNRDSGSPSSEQKKRKLLPGNSKGKYLIPAKRTTKTLDGKTAAFQNAQDMAREAETYKQLEEDMFEKLCRESNVFNKPNERKTGKNADLARKAQERAEREKEDAKYQEIYSRWGHGLKQLQAKEDKLAQDLHEMNKPLARYADDEDLENHLKQQIREEDPMLQFMKKKDPAKPGTVLKQSCVFSFLPNRFGIPPGHQWDGVDRSNGYEVKFIDTQNSKMMKDEESYKWSTEDM